MSTPDEAPRPAPSPRFLDLVSAIFARPADAGESLARKPMGLHLVAALAVCIGATLAASLITMPQAIEVAAEQVKNVDMPAEQRARTEEFFEGPMMKTFIVLQSLLLPGLGIPIIALLLYLGQAVMGGRASFLQCLSVTAFSCIISFGLGGLVKAGLIVAKGSLLEVSTGLGILVPDRPFDDPLRSALDVLDVFLVWAVVCCGIALAPAAKLGRGATIGVSVLVYVLMMAPLTLLRILKMGGGG